jgi:hypothetical protein
VLSGLQMVPVGPPPSSPFVFSQPVNQMVFQGSIATFSVVAAAATPLAYQWLFNNADISGATNSSYSVINAQPVNDGNYSIIVSNSYGSVTSAVAQLIATGPVSKVIDVAFTGQPTTSKTGFAATGVSLNDFWNTEDVDTTSDLPNLKFTDGTASGAGLTEGNVYSVGSNGSSDPMYGVYAYAGDNIILTVTNLPPGLYDFYLYGHGSIFELTVGSQSYGCEATTNGSGWLYSEWQEGNQYVEFADVSVDPGQPITIIVEPGAGHFVLYGPGAAEISGLQMANVSETYSPPFISSEPADQTVLLGTTATFSVVADGAMPLAYQWFYNNTDILGATNSSYRVTNALPANAGDYLVILSNSYGSVTSAAAALTVINFSILAQPTNQLAFQGGNATFMVEVTGSPPLSYQWLFNNADIAGATNSSYSVTNAQLTNAGGYSVIVTNAYGSITSTVATLAVTNILISMQPASQSVLVGAGAIFAVEAVGLAPLSYQWLFNNAAISGATTNSFSVNNAAFSSVGQYSVVITNAYGSITSAVATLQVVTPTLIDVAFTSATVTGKT